MNEIDYSDHPAPWEVIQTQPGVVRQLRRLRPERIQILRSLGVTTDNITRAPEIIIRGLWHARLAEDLAKLRDVREALAQEATAPK